MLLAEYSNMSAQLTQHADPNFKFDTTVVRIVMMQLPPIPLLSPCSGNLVSVLTVAY